MRTTALRDRATLTDSLSTAVIRTIAEFKDVDPLDLERPLQDVIDTDALDGIFAPSAGTERREGLIVFMYDGVEVRVSSEGHVDVNDVDDP